MEAIIKIENLTKHFKNTLALNNISLEIFQGELFGLLGINGAGKSTLIKILSCLMHQTSGKATIYDFDTEKKENEVKKFIAIAPQDTSVAMNLTVFENLKFFAEIHFKDKETQNEKIEEMIKLFCLESVLKKKAKSLSGGFKKRLSIALSLISNPKILFLDEPTLGLDIVARRMLWDIILSLKGKTTIILTTHYLEEIESLCDRVGILCEGNLKFQGTIEECITKTGEKSFEDAFIKLSTGGEI